MLLSSLDPWSWSIHQTVLGGYSPVSKLSMRRARIYWNAFLTFLLLLLGHVQLFVHTLGYSTYDEW
jgi:hypothetical protein